MFSFFKKKEVKTNGSNGLLPKEIVDEIKDGVFVKCTFGHYRAIVSLGDYTLFLSNKGSKNLLYKEVWRTEKYVGSVEIDLWLGDGKLPARTKKNK